MVPTFIDRGAALAPLYVGARFVPREGPFLRRCSTIWPGHGGQTSRSAL